MSDDNPFARLGLQKEIVESLHRQGRLEEFLHTYYRSIQVHIHPDRGGDSALATVINSAYATINQRPSNIEAWIKGMNNSNKVNLEYLAIIEGLTAKVEEYQGMEKDYRKLQEDYATLLASQNGEETKAEVRKESPRAKERVSSKAEPIVLENLVSYGMDGRPAAKYNVYLDGEAVRKADGSYLMESQRGFEKYFASKKDGRRLPNLREVYAIIERLHDTKNPALSGIVKDMKKLYLCIGTGINYKDNVIVHSGYAPIKCTIPARNHWLDEVIKNEEGRKIVQAMFGPKDVKKVPELLQTISGRRPYLWTPDASGRKSYPERVVWLYIGTDRFLLICDGNPILSDCRARGVRVESA